MLAAAPNSHDYPTPSSPGDPPAPKEHPIPRDSLPPTAARPRALPGTLSKASMQSNEDIPDAQDALPSPLALSAPSPSANTPASAVKDEPQDLSVFTAAAAAPTANLDHHSALAPMLPSPSGANGDGDHDRKPDLPPPFPFASTSAAAREVDAARQSRSPAASGSGSGSGSGASTPAGTSVQGEAGAEEGEEEAILRHLEEVRAAGKGGGGAAGGSSSKARKGKLPESEPQLIGDLPVAEDEAGRTYTELDGCIYANKQIGDTAYYDEDAVRCDCTVDPEDRTDVPEDEQACGDHSQCINRMMQIECVKGDCRCGKRCQNQRFQKRQYAPIEIVKTEKKGFGVRAAGDIPADAFVYEYVGEVIGPEPFQRKMKAYANEGIKHFYFMALDRDVFIDATKKGGKGRFLNHSCNPNCVVAKWTVGRKMRMGIFTKRAIKKDEELTFNYNVDRYGHVAQECFCGEPNCVGFIGGKTQTDLGGMDDLYIDALGIADEVEALGLKGSKKKKGKKLDEDFVPTLHPIQLDEVPKVSAALRQALQTRRILEKLLTRVQLTTDDDVLRGLMRLHGFNLMHNVLREYPQDVHVITLDLEILSKWKLSTRNKIESSKIEDSVAKCAADIADEKVQTLAKDLLATWADLQLGYRIPKALVDASDDPDRKRPSSFDFEQLSKRARSNDYDAHAADDPPEFVRPEANQFRPSLPRPSRRLPDGWDVRVDRDLGREVFVNVRTGAVQWEVPTRAASGAADTPPLGPAAVALDANALIAQAEQAAREAKEAEERRVADEKRAVDEAKERERAERHERKRAEKEDKLRAQKDKKVMGLFSSVVVATMSKYKAQFEPEAFKKRAREVSELLCEKEKKRPSYATDTYDSLGPEKEAKVKSFVKDWTKKLLERKKASAGSSSSSARRQSSSSSTPRRPESASTPATPSLAATDLGADAISATPKPDAATNGHAQKNGGRHGSPPHLAPAPTSTA
ncbi:hypothetical protein Rhopal_006822-T1 [Rhodotorula paludigena]|uniref:Histone-lysine N-methyltransferase, H3 lysine-36 specific n=1 Tax=Rhodotorula paludigena TaxID=86838 RepID=A0AAV5GWB0_9BASI|nr:hypothetical protein Rhopal_006822-T1 [Rhodotorula paludigena]